MNSPQPLRKLLQNSISFRIPFCQPMNSSPCPFLGCLIHFCRRAIGNPATKLPLSTQTKWFSAFSGAQLTNEGFPLTPVSPGSLLPNACSVISHALSTQHPALTGNRWESTAPSPASVDSDSSRNPSKHRQGMRELADMEEEFGLQG